MSGQPHDMLHVHNFMDYMCLPSLSGDPLPKGGDPRPGPARVLLVWHIRWHVLAAIFKGDCLGLALSSARHKSRRHKCYDKNVVQGRRNVGSHKSVRSAMDGGEQIASVFHEPEPDMRQKIIVGVHHAGGGVRRGAGGVFRRVCGMKGSFIASV